MSQAKPRKRAATRPAGGVSGAPPAWRQLCDHFFADHACEAVQVEIECATAGHANDLHVPLRTDLVRPLEAYLAEHWTEKGAATRIDLKAAQALLDAAEDLAQKCEERFPFGPGSGALYANALRDAWRRFSDSVGGPTVLNTSIVQAKRASAERTPKQSKHSGQKLTASLLRTKIAEGLASGLYANKKDAMRQVEKEFGVSRRTQYRLLSQP